MPRPLVVAHRGANGELAEHTLAAYRRAIDEGADAVECDVRLTADGHLVLVHDRTIDRTSNGAGVVAAMSLQELALHDYGIAADQLGTVHSSPVSGDPVMLDDEKRSILTLRRLLEVVTSAPRPVGLSIETKHPSRFGAYVERLVVEMLAEFGLQESPTVRLMSFSMLGVRRVRRLAPALERVFLIDDHLTWWWGRRTPPFGIRTAGPSVEYLRTDPDYVARMRERGVGVHVWTVDQDDDIDLCVDVGVEAIISNRPGYVLDRLGR